MSTTAAGVSFEVTLDVHEKRVQNGCKRIIMQVRDVK